MRGNIRLTEGSLFWKVLTLNGTHSAPTNGCELFWTMILILGLSVIAIMTVLGVGFIIYNIFFGDIDWIKTLIIFTVVLVSYFVIGVTVYLIIEFILKPIHTWYKRKKGGDMSPKEPSNIKKMYLGWKDKYCPLVEVVSDSKSKDK